MQTIRGQLDGRPGYSLGEVLVAMVIGVMILVAILTVYDRANHAAESVLSKIESPALAAEVLQLMAEDLDRAFAADDNVSIQVQNRLDNRFASAQLILRHTLRDSKNQEQVFEEIIWRGGYDYEGAVPGLVIYRSHEGIVLEDKLLDDQRETWERNYPFVPVCRGVTFFSIEVPKDDEYVDQWSDAALPPGVKVTISFAEPYETVQGRLEVPEEAKIGRTIAVNKARQIKFVMSAEEQAAGEPNAATGGQPSGGSTSTGGQPPRELRPSGNTDAPLPNRTRPR